MATGLGASKSESAAIVAGDRDDGCGPRQRLSLFARAGLVGASLGVAGVLKLLDPHTAAIGLQDRASGFAYRDAISAVRAIATLEVLTSIGVWIPALRVHAGLTAVVAGVAIGVATALDLIIGVESACGCFGALEFMEHGGVRSFVAVVVIASGWGLMRRAVHFQNNSGA